ncbi:MAG: S8 family serine peptidase [Pseudomonadota bacterium]
MSVTNNPLYGQQWHFSLIGDINAVWADYTGNGVTVGVYDDGTEQGHEDLIDNYDSSLHYSGIFGSDDGQPNTSTDSHGTAVAGIIASANNGVGGVGVAYDSTIAGVDLLEDLSPSNSFSATLEAMRFMDNFDITCNSWGYTPSYSDFLNLGDPFAQGAREVAAMSSATVDGRGGLGTIIVKAAGNDNNNSTLESQGLLGNAQGEGHNSAHTIITVAATDQSGNVASYSNWGVNLLITAPAASVTTDRTGLAGYDTDDYTNTFGGTSAATPVVAGVAALMLEANSGLGWRDVQNIMAISASHTGSSYGSAASGFEEGTWFSNGATNWNGGGMSYHISYGFGMIDAFAAVRMAEIWDVLYPAAQVTGNEVIATASNAGTFAINDFQTTTITVSTTASVLVEHIYVEITGTHTYLGDLNMRLVSPTGEIYELFRREGLGTDLNGSWTFGVAAALGVVANAGDWRVEIVDNAGGDTGTITGLELTFHGAAVDTNTVHHITMDFNEYAGQEAARRTISDTDGGTDDWLNMAAITGNVTLNLSAGGAIVVGGSTWANIAAGTNIENAATGDGNDSVTGSASDNHILGGRGNDTLLGGLGNDSLDGGLGNDSLLGGDQNDTIAAGEGNDTVAGGNGRDLVFLNQGNDLFNDNTEGGVNGQDTVFAGLGADTIQGGNGNDEFHGQDGNDLINGRLGNDLIYGGNQYDTIYAGEGNDTVAGGNGRDLVFLNQGNDLFNDNTQGGVNGQDTVFAGLGNDTVQGGNGNDVFRGEDGNDVIFGRLGNDLIYGGNQYDTIYAGDGRDTVVGGNGRDLVFLNQGDDIFHDNPQGGDLGRDTVFGGFGNDTIQGGNGNDQFFGEDGNDLINGRLGNDVIGGGAGLDTINGGSGSDTLTGGADADTFVFNAADASSGDDLVTDFELGTDVFQISGASTATVVYDSGANEITVSLGGDLLATLRSGSDLSGFDVNDIVFV